MYTMALDSKAIHNFCIYGILDVEMSNGRFCIYSILDVEMSNGRGDLPHPPNIIYPNSRGNEILPIS